ncbi:hypothetical protein [Paenibacillus sp. ISL-20]|uniref:hypothetical protein n=1 Tax=Paenibacillus sp. ISL-20 TaxID=2819163 RepID=UPI001BE59F03|nr:hypothetical protein [Paenibacillus sp. ISL-20]MBT2759987.1 hypothetical protein [Paenibacillus sp. ISL-20]
MKESRTTPKDCMGTSLSLGDVIEGENIDGKITRFVIKWSEYRNQHIGENPDEAYDVSQELFHRYEKVGNTNGNPTFENGRFTQDEFMNTCGICNNDLPIDHKQISRKEEDGTTTAYHIGCEYDAKKVKPCEDCSHHRLLCIDCGEPLEGEKI